MIIKEKKRGRPKKELPPIEQQEQTPLYVLLPAFWGISTNTSYLWVQRKFPVTNLVKMIGLITGMKQPSQPAKAKAVECMDVMNEGGTVSYFGKDWTQSDLEQVNGKPLEPGDELTLEEYIRWLGRLLNAAKDANDLSRIGELQPLYLKAVESKDRTELAAKKLGIDSLEIIPRSKFVQLLRLIAWELVQKTDGTVVSLAKATAGCKSPNAVYNKAHPIIFKATFEKPFARMTRYAKKLEVPEWVIAEMVDLIADYKANGEAIMARYLSIEEKPKC